MGDQKKSKKINFGAMFHSVCLKLTKLPYSRIINCRVETLHTVRDSNLKVLNLKTFMQLTYAH